MTIIEFFGCPGVGKSSLCVKVMEALSEQGFSAANIHRNELRKGRLFRKMLSARALMSPRTRDLKKAIDVYAQTLPQQHCPWKRDVLNSAYKLEQRYVKNTDYVFFEEGPTQYLTSIPHDKKVTEQIGPLIDEINRSFYDHGVIAFYIKADEDEIIKRLQGRGKPGDRFVADDENRMRSLIETKIYNIEQIAKMLRYQKMYDIENNDLDKAATQIVDIIRSL